MGKLVVKLLSREDERYFGWRMRQLDRIDQSFAEFQIFYRQPRHLWFNHDRGHWWKRAGSTLDISGYNQFRTALDMWHCLIVWFFVMLGLWLAPRITA